MAVTKRLHQKLTREEKQTRFDAQGMLTRAADEVAGLILEGARAGDKKALEMAAKYSLGLPISAKRTIKLPELQGANPLEKSRIISEKARLIWSGPPYLSSLEPAGSSTDTMSPSLASMTVWASFSLPERVTPRLFCLSA